jgi:DNA invertase Pin-like site-specific DNA recombinase
MEASEKRKRRSRPQVGDAALAVAYLRTSTEEQKLGLEVQRREVSEWAARKNITIAAWFVEEGVSGATDPEDCPRLQEALKALGEQRAGWLVVQRRDRLARDPLKSAGIQLLVRKRGAQVVSADGIGEGMDDHMAQLVRFIDDWKAAVEKRDINLRIRKALRMKRERSELVGKPPLGMRLAQDGRTLVPDEREAKAQSRATELRSCQLSIRAIAERLAAEGFVSRSGKPYGAHSVHTMLGRARAQAAVAA